VSRRTGVALFEWAIDLFLGEAKKRPNGTSSERRRLPSRNNHKNLAESTHTIDKLFSRLMQKKASKSGKRGVSYGLLKTALLRTKGLYGI